ncbi:MAG: hypothetical protein JO101_07945 [Candidatus Eremiobacteraeota bacterium]|nr:hypothetical protein [Candidatus Eremiobacteraeota bacterium]
MKEIARDSNHVLFQVIEDVAQACMDNKPGRFQPAMLETKCKAFLARFHDVRDAFIAENEAALSERRAKMETGERQRELVAF